MEPKSPWTQAEKDQWYREQTVKRSYQTDVVAQIESLRPSLEVVGYGALSYDPARYPLYYLRTRGLDENRKTVLITGGVHGYETSGVHGALAFMQNEARNYAEHFNIVCFPCISPWGYETINRWNPRAVDPNRSFRADSPAEECRFFLAAAAELKLRPWAHFDLHETTDTDNTIFRPMLARRDGKAEELSEIPDGFYLVGDAANPQPEFQKAIIDRVRKVTHIAPADRDGKIIGDVAVQEGVINYDKKKLFLCGGFSDAEYITTTEVYPDSPHVTGAICIRAQVEALKGGLDFLITKM